MPRLLRQTIFRLIVSPQLLKIKRWYAERQRLRKKKGHIVTVYLRINDSYSYLLLQSLRQLKQRYPIELEFRTILNLQSDMYPAPALWQHNAFADCQYLAKLYPDTLSFEDQAPKTTPQRDAQLTAQLLHWELQPNYLENALALFEAYWQSDQSAITALVNPAITEQYQCYQHHLAANEQLLKTNGHYLSAMLHYGSEWYWGIDRLHYLEQRLNHLLATDDSKVVFDQGYKHFCQRMSTAEINARREKHAPQEPITMYFSARSPYSYLGLVRARKLSEHYQIPLNIKPVLPMVMRRMQVPNNKGFYIFGDSKREANTHGIAFGLWADPLGKGVENCYALYEFALSENKALDFLESYARGVWSEGIPADTNQGLEKLVSRAGLDWQHAKTLLDKNDWQIWAQDNIAELYANDQWGVPCFKFKDTFVFGQDRLDRIELAIVDALNG